MFVLDLPTGQSYTDMRFIGFERKLLLLLLQIEDLIQLRVLPVVLPGVLHEVPPGVPHTGPVAALTGAPVLRAGRPRVLLPPPHLALTEAPPVGGRSCRPGNIIQFFIEIPDSFSD